MTREEILALSPGRELDSLVAEKVMGWERDFQCWKDESGRIRTIEPTSFGSFEPSTDIAAAWDVVDKLKLVITPQSEGAPEEMSYMVEYEDEPHVSGIRVFARTAPEAISKVALLAVIDT